MLKVGKSIFSEVQIVLYQMQCSETQLFVVFFLVPREPNVHRIQRITRLLCCHTFLGSEWMNVFTFVCL